MAAADRHVAGGFVVRVEDGAVVAHAALENMPFEHSIQPWVRSYFPGSSFPALDQDRVAAADFSLLAPGVLVIQAPKGAGKSKAIRDAVHAQLPPRASVLQVTFRRSLAWSSCAMMGSAGSLYSALPEGAISARQHPRLTIVINSISRVRGTYDVVVIDEVVSVLDMLAGSLLNNSARVAAVATLAALVGAARTVVIADAMLDASCVDFVLLCRQMAAAAAMGPPRYWPDPLANVRFLDYTRRLHSDYAFVPHAKLASWAAALEAAVSAGQRVVVPCMTKAQAEALAAKYQPAYAVQLYTGDTDAALLQQHMTDIHAHWGRAAILIYSPVITAGCSFELAHFDTVFFYGCARLGSVRSAIQMIARVRDVRTKTVHVFLSKAESYEPLEAALLRRDPVYATVTDYPDGYMKLLDLLGHHRRLEALCSAAAFPYYFWSLVVHSGARIQFAPRQGKGGCTAVAPPLPVAAVAHSAQEQWWLHDWEGAEVAMGEYDIAAAQAVVGTLLERAAQLQPDHLVDLGACAGVPPTAITAAPPEPILPAWMAAAPGRAKVWARLMARRVAAVPGAATVAADTWKRLALGPLAQPHIVLYPPVGIHLRRSAPVDALAALYAHAARYMDPALSWMDVTAAAWALAGVEARAAELPMGGGAIAEALQIAARVGHALSRFRVKVLHVGACVGSQAATSPHRFTPAAALADFLVEDLDGRFHVVMVRVEGQARQCAPTDVMKLRILAAASDVPVATVTMLYLGSNEMVHVATAAPSPILDGLVATSPAYVRAWQPLAHVAFAYVGSGGVVTCFKEVCIVHTDTGRALEHLASLPVRVVGWGLGGAGDLQCYVQSRLRLSEEDILDIYQANVLDTYPCAPTGVGPMDHLRSLYLGICKKRFFVYFWNGKPHGVHTPSLQL